LWSRGSRIAFDAGSAYADGQIKMRGPLAVIVTSPVAVIRDLQPVSSGGNAGGSDGDVGSREHGHGLFQAVQNHCGRDGAAETAAINVHFNRVRVPGIESERHFIDGWNLLVIIVIISQQPGRNDGKRD
jgi:hypothetical protein